MTQFNAGRHVMPLCNKTYVMGILNVTPDSFSDGGEWIKVDKAIERALEIERLGANILDIGAQSTRPGYKKISANKEWDRLEPVLNGLKGKIKIPISIDTFYYEVAKSALDIGVDIINDITGFEDENMIKTAAKSRCGCIVMHNGPGVNIKSFFEDRLNSMNNYGIERDRICFDPGIGFGKTYEENLYILKNIKSMCVEGCGMLVGASRKRVIGKPCGDPSFIKRMPGTIAAHTIAVMGGANIIRVHDVEEAIQAAKVADAILHI